MFSVHNLSQRIAEDVGIVAVVISPLQFLNVAIHVLDAHLVECAHERTLEQAPDALDAVCVNVANNPFIFGMPHSLMACVVVADSDIRPHLIRINGLCFVFHSSMDEVMERFPLYIRNALDANISTALDGSHNPRFVALVGMALTLHLAAYKCFVNFHDSKERRAIKRLISHRLADSVAEIPSRFVGNAKRSFHLVSGNALFRLTHEVDGNKPFSQRKVGIMHDGSSRNAELVAA